MAASKLTDFQTKRLNILAEAILDLSPLEQEVLWRKYRDTSEEMFGLDPAMFSECYPKVEGAEMTEQHLDFFKHMSMSGGFPGGFVDSIIEGKTADLFP
jgi:hypothetical protein